MPCAFNPPGVWQPFGAFSLVTLQGDGQVVHLKGQVPLYADGNIVGIGDMPAQVDNFLENIQAALAALGGEMGDILSLTQHTTDIAAFMTSGDVHARYFKERYPARTTLEVPAFYHPDIMEEITAIAEIPRGRFVHP